MMKTDWMRMWADYSPGKIAVKEIESGKSATYEELNNSANYLAYKLTQQLGLKKGDRVMIMAEHCLEYVILFSAAQKTGLVLIPINYRLAAGEVDYLIGNAEPTLFIFENKFAPIVDKLTKLGEVDYQLSQEELVTFCLEGKACDINFNPTVLEEEDPIFILYTSGTTGFPKGALYTHKMLFWNSINTTIGLNITSEEVTILSMPPFHTGGWNVLLTPILHRGGTVGLMRKFDAASILEALEQEKANVFMAVPTMLKMMVESPNFSSVDLSAIKYFIVGGEALPLPVIEKWHNRGVKLRQGYGLTEVGPNLTSLHHDDATRKIGSIGKPNFYVNVKVIDDYGAEVAQGEIGEFCFSGRIVTPGYWKNEEASAASFDNGWFKTGDLVKEDEEGYFYVMDRKKNMFISGGENVYPAEVERVLAQHPAVSEVAVTAIKDAKWGEVGKAHVVTKQPVNHQEILDFLDDKLAKFKIPKDISFIDIMPKTDSGKIDKKSLS